MSRRARGQSVVELALILPAFLALVFGVLDGGNLVYTALTLDHGVQEGTRVATLPSTTTASAVKNAVRANANGLSIPDANITISVNSGAKTYPTRATGDRVAITATYVYNSIVASAFGMHLSLTLTARSEVGAE